MRKNNTDVDSCLRRNDEVLLFVVYLYLYKILILVYRLYLAMISASICARSLPNFR